MTFILSLRDSSPTGISLKKQPWTHECVEAVMNVFETEVNGENNIISGKEINDLIFNTPCLKTRTAAQIRAWIHNKRKSILNDSCNRSPKEEI